MEDSYDVIILGTGLKECVLAGILSKEGKKVLHMDRNDYYGAECASLTMAKLFEHFEEKADPDAEALGKLRDWNVDLIPKFLMGKGELVKALIYSGVSRYLDFKVVENNFVYQAKKGVVAKVPTTPKEALGSPLMGMMQKKNLVQFTQWVHKFDPADPKTYSGGFSLWGSSKLTEKSTMAECYKYWNLTEDTINFVGHALAFYTEDSYLERPMTECIAKCQLYLASIMQYQKSPFLYPLYGLGELPQSFARLSAIYGGTYMLNRPVETGADGFEITDGKVTGVRAKDPDSETPDAVVTVKAPMVIGDPTYFPHKRRETGKVVRAICLLDHPLPNTLDCSSCQLIIPYTETGGKKKNDIFILSISDEHKVAAAGRYIAIASTFVETAEPEAELELAFKLIGPYLKKFVSVSSCYEPTDDGKADNLFITSSYDASTHFDTTMKDIAAVYERAMGKKLDMSEVPAEGGADGAAEGTG